MREQLKTPAGFEVAIHETMMKTSPRAKPALTCVAFLRGINITGNNLVKMDVLKKALESFGFKNVKTVLASGNVVFDTAPENCDKLAGRIGECLRELLGKEIGVIVRTLADLERLVSENPFKSIELTPQTRFYVTFLSERPPRKPVIPEKLRAGGVSIVRLSDDEVCTAITLSPDLMTADLMHFLDQGFGRKVTTRNWNTILRILTAGGSQS